MKPRPEPIPLSQPLREVKVARFGDRQTLREQDLSASYEQGRLAGERALNEQLVRQRAEVIELQTGVLTALREAVPDVARQCERALITLAIEAAQRLVGGLPITPEMLEGVIKEACSAVEDTASFTVLLHPEDLAMLQRINSPILLPQGGHDRIQFQPSTQVSRGGCLVQTRFGIMDARRETKIELLQKTLLP